MNAARFFAGASGFSYDNWKPGFYPADLPSKKYLEYYSRRVNSVEINYTFRRNPNRTTLQAWDQATPAGFQFVLKAHQRVTHGHKPEEMADAAAYFFRCIEPLDAAGKLGPVLVQLPPWRKANPDVLERYLGNLPVGYRHAIEFRDPSWLTDETYRRLEERNICLCLAESEKLVIPEVLTADFVYLRLRMPEYSEAELEHVRERVEHLLRDARTVYLFFKHEEGPEGVLNAERLLASVDAGPRTPAATDASA